MIFELAGCGMVLADLAGERLLRVNRKFCQFVGYTAEELLDKVSLTDLTPPEDLARARTGLERLMRGEIEEYRTEKQYRRKDGQLVWGEVTVTLLKGAGGAPDRTISCIQDISDRKRAEAALREAEWKIREEREHARRILAGALNHTHMLAACLDVDFNFILVNQAYARADGREPDFFTGRNHFELYPNAENEAIFRRVLETGEPYFAQAKPFEYEHNQERGTSYWNWSLMPVKEQDRVTLLVLTLNDVTALVGAEQRVREQARALAETDRRKDEFLAMLAHELRNPLAPVRNAIQILRTVGAGEERVRRHYDMIERQVAHMARLLDDLLDVSRVTRGKIELRRAPLRLADVLAHAVEVVGPLADGRGLTLHFTPPGDALWVEGDQDRLAQVVNNLLTNAVKYTDGGGRVWLEAGREAGELFVRVRDTGIGIAPEMLEHVFDLFAQADTAKSRPYKGLGIGLTMARSLVRMHGGRMEARSAGAGQGSEFTFWLPALAAAPRDSVAAPLPPPARVAAGQGLRVLVTDDVADSAESLCELLMLWGHEPRMAQSGEEALAAAREFSPEVVLLDIGMPGMDGFETARRLRAMLGAGPVLVALTGYGQRKDQEASREAGFDHHLVKPVNLKMLREMLRELARRGD